MRTQDIVIGRYYRHRTSPHFAYAKALKVIKPIPKYKQKYAYDRTSEEKKIRYTVVKCEWNSFKDSAVGLIKYFRPCDLIKELVDD